MAKYRDYVITTFLGAAWKVSADIDALWYRASMEHLMYAWGLKDFDIVIERDENREPRGLRFSWTIRAKSEKSAGKRAGKLFDQLMLPALPTVCPLGTFRQVIPLVILILPGVRVDQSRNFPYALLLVRAVVEDR